MRWKHMVNGFKAEEEFEDIDIIEETEDETNGKI